MEAVDTAKATKTSSMVMIKEDMTNNMIPEKVNKKSKSNNTRGRSLNNQAK